MGFLVPALEAAAPSILGGLVAGGANAVMGGSNGALSGMLGENNIFQTGLMGQEMAAQQQLDLQATVFDEAMDQQAENMRRFASTISIATFIARATHTARSVSRTASK